MRYMTTLITFALFVGCGPSATPAPPSPDGGSEQTCQADEDCPDGVCQTEDQICTECATSEDCTEAGRTYCRTVSGDPQANSCARCITHSHCPGDRRCFRGDCVQ